MNSIPAQEIKRLGISAVDEALRLGPVHVVKNKRPRYVVLTEEDYDLAAEERTFMRAVVAGLADLDAGREVSLSEAKARFGLA